MSGSSAERRGGHRQVTVGRHCACGRAPPPGRGGGCHRLLSDSADRAGPPRRRLGIRRGVLGGPLVEEQRVNEHRLATQGVGRPVAGPAARGGPVVRGGQRARRRPRSVARPRCLRSRGHGAPLGARWRPRAADPGPQGRVDRCVAQVPRALPGAGCASGSRIRTVAVSVSPGSGRRGTRAGHRRYGEVGGRHGAGTRGRGSCRWTRLVQAVQAGVAGTAGQQLPVRPTAADPAVSRKRIRSASVTVSRLCEIISVVRPAMSRAGGRGPARSTWRLGRSSARRAAAPGRRGSSPARWRAAGAGRRTAAGRVGPTAGGVPVGQLGANRWTSAARAACSISCPWRPGRPQRMLSAIVPSKTSVSCSTAATLRRRSDRESRGCRVPSRVTAPVGVVEAQQQLGQRRLARPARADHGDLLARARSHVDPAQRRPLGVGVGEGDPRTARAPRRPSGPGRGVDDGGLLVEHLDDPFGAGLGRGHLVPQAAEPGHRPVQLADVGDEDEQLAERQPPRWPAPTRRSPSPAARR